MSNILNLGDVVLPGDGYLNIFGASIPIIGGLTGAYLLANGDISGRNYAPGGTNSDVVGAPVVTDGGLTLSGSNYLNTGLTQTTDATMVAAIRFDQGTGAASAINNYTNSPREGMSIFDSAGTSSIAAGSVVRGGAVSQTFTTAPADVYQLYSLQYGASKNTTFKNHTAMTTGEDTTNTSSSIGLSANPILIGRSTETSQIAPIDIGFVLIYSRVLTPSEMVEIETWAKGYKAAYGVTV